MDSGHLRVAITTNSLIQVDANFVQARQMVFYDVTGDSADFVDVVHFTRSGKKGPGGGRKAGGGCVMDDMEDDDGSGVDPMTARVEAAKGSSILFTRGMSDLAAVRLHQMAVYPIKTEQVRAIDDVIANLQRLLGGTPPLWLRRVLRDQAGDRLPLDEQPV